MRKALVTLATAFSLTTSGCTYVAHDLRNTGGAVGGVLDRHMFDASGSKELVLLRSAILIAMVARAGTVYSRDERDADAYVNYLVSAVDEINILAGDIYPTRKGFGCSIARAASPAASTAGSAADAKQAKAADVPDAAGGEAVAGGQTGTVTAADAQPQAPAETPDSASCFTYAVNFESDVPMIERRLFRLAMAGLPQQQAKQFLDQVTKGNALGAVIAAFNFSVKALDGLHSGAAVERTGLEIVAGQYRPCANADHSTVADAASCLGLPLNQLIVGKQDGRSDYVKEVPPAAFRALMRNIRDSCRMVPLGLQGDESESLDAVRNRRIALCDQIEFIPRSRWETKAQIDDALNAIGPNAS
jgi:hypothetical protein